MVLNLSAAIETPPRQAKDTLWSLRHYGRRLLSQQWLFLELE
jgi:hypothetical protein